jgi:hypothetical protein
MPGRRDVEAERRGKDRVGQALEHEEEADNGGHDAIPLPERLCHVPSSYHR